MMRKMLIGKTKEKNISNSGKQCSKIQSWGSSWSVPGAESQPVWLELGEQEGELKIRPVRGQRHMGKAVSHGMVLQLCSKYKKALNNFKHKSNIIYIDGQQAHEKLLTSLIIQFSFVQSLSRVQLFATPWIAAHQASLSITNSWSSLKLKSIESVMPSSHLILCRPLLLLPPIPPSIRVFSTESTLCMRWPKY